MNDLNDLKIVTTPTMDAATQLQRTPSPMPMELIEIILGFLDVETLTKTFREMRDPIFTSM
jgi:hypothetical protein